jgi:hypothetical protein
MPLATPGDRANIRAWDSIDVYTAVVGSTAPTDTSTALNAAFTALGLMSDDQLVRTRNVDRTELRSLGGRMVRVKRQAQSVQFGFTALENSHKVFTVANPGSSAVTATGITTRTFKEQTTTELAVVIEASEGTNITRLWIPRAEIFSDGDTTMGPSDMYETPMTAIVYPDSSDILFYEITNDTAAAAS